MSGTNQESKHEEVKVDIHEVEFSDRVRKLFDLPSSSRWKKPGNEKQYDRVHSALQTVAVCLAVVSFFATYDGLANCIFTNDHWRAALVSLAVQTILLTMALGFPRYLGLTGRGKKRIPFVLALLFVYLFSLVGSVFFGFVFLTNSSYEANNEGLRIRQASVEEKYINLSDKTTEYLEICKKAYEKQIISNLGSINNVLDKVGANEDVVNESKNGIDSLSDNNLYFSDGEARSMAESALELARAYDSEDAIELIAKAEKKVSTLEDEKAKKEDEKAEKEKEYDLLNAKDERDLDPDEQNKLKKEIENLENDIATCEDQMSFYQTINSCLTVIGLSSSDLARSAISNMLVDMLNMDGESLELGETDNAAAITKSLQTLAELVLSSEDMLENPQQTLEDYDTVTQFADTVYGYVSICESITKINSLLSGLPDDDIDQGGVDEESWSASWLSTLSDLKSIIRSMSELIEEDNLGAIDEDKYSVFNEYNYQMCIESINALELYQLGSASKIEMAFWYFTSDNSALAIASLVIAAYLDIASFVIGLFMFYRKKALQQKSKAHS